MKVKNKIFVENRKAKFLYSIDESFESGIELKGTEVKSLRNNRCSLQEAYAHIHNREIFLYQWHIALYGQNSHEPLRPKKLLLKKKEINKLQVKLKIDRITIFPINLFENKKGKIKLTLGIGKGKNIIDRRKAIKERDRKREENYNNRRKIF